MSKDVETLAGVTVKQQGGVRLQRYRDIRDMILDNISLPPLQESSGLPVLTSLQLRVLRRTLCCSTLLLLSHILIDQATPCMPLQLHQRRYTALELNPDRPDSHLLRRLQIGPYVIKENRLCRVDALISESVLVEGCLWLAGADDA